MKTKQQVQSVLVTGGAGFIGSHLIDRLIQLDRNVICLDNFDPFYPAEVKRKNIARHMGKRNFQLVEADIRSKADMQSLFKNRTIDGVVHLAARPGVRPSIEDPLLYEDVNIKGTLNLLEACKEFQFRSFVFGSSSSVYGLQDEVPFKEDRHSSKPISPYAATKQAGELLCHLYHHLYHMRVTCLRFFTVYGPRQRPDMAIHKFTRLIDRGEEIPCYGDGSSQRDYTYISDIIEGIISALDRKLDFEIINLGDSETTELRCIVSLIEGNLGKRAKVRELPVQPGDVPITCADISKAKKLLNYDPKVRIEEGISNFVQWYQNRGH